MCTCRSACTADAGAGDIITLHSSHLMVDLISQVPQQNTKINKLKSPKSALRHLDESIYCNLQVTMKLMMPRVSAILQTVGMRVDLYNIHMYGTWFHAAKHAFHVSMSGAQKPGLRYDVHSASASQSSTCYMTLNGSTRPLPSTSTTTSTTGSLDSHNHSHLTAVRCLSTCSTKHGKSIKPSTRWSVIPNRNQRLRFLDDIKVRATCYTLLA